MKQHCHVAIIYPFVPHYRRAVFQAMQNARGRFRYTIFAGDNVIDPTIKALGSGDGFELRNAPVMHWAGLTLQSGLSAAVLGREFDVMVFLGNPYILSSWYWAILARLRGKRVFFWTHGWLEREAGAKGFLRKAYYHLANGLLLYGERARRIGLEAGFRSDRLSVIFNSLDYDAQSEVRESLWKMPGRGRELLPQPIRDWPTYLACIARLTPECHFEIAIDAIAQINATSEHSLPLVLIGDGPERDALERQALSRGVQVAFLGAVYDEQLVGVVLTGARAVVSPGKVGLTAMHALAYGIPVLTHGDLNEQGPEVEAIIPGVTGDLFAKGDAGALAATLRVWLARAQTPQEREKCIAVVEERYTPEGQVRLIEAALLPLSR